MNIHGYVPFLVITIRSFHRSLPITGFVTRVIYFTYSAGTVYPSEDLTGRCYSVFIFLCSVLYIIVCHLVLFFFSIVCHSISGFWLSLWYLQTFLTLFGLIWLRPESMIYTSLITPQMRSYFRCYLLIYMYVYRYIYIWLVNSLQIILNCLVFVLFTWFCFLLQLS